MFYFTDIIFIYFFSKYFYCINKIMVPIDLELYGHMI